MKFEICDATPKDVVMLGMNMREADSREVLRSGWQNPVEACVDSFNDSRECFVFKCDDVPVCIWGVRPVNDLTRSGVAWFLSGKLMDDKKVVVEFIRQCKKHFVILFNRYDRLYNYVDAEYIKSIRWLRWLGFTVSDKAEPFGTLKRPFHLVEARRS